MSIVSSSFVIDAHAQADGTKYVVQQFSDSQGRTWRDTPYKLAAGHGSVEAQARLDAAVSYLNEQLAKGEAQEIISRAPATTLTLFHQAPSQFAAFFWEQLKVAFLLGDKLKFARMVWWLHGRVVAGDFTSNDVRLTFNTAYNRSLSVAQWNSFVTSTLVPIKDRYQAMLDQADL